MSEAGHVPPDSPANPPPGRRAVHRWQAFFQRAAEPLFLLDRRRRLRFVNRAWERVAEVAAAQVEGLVCTGDPDSTPADPRKRILARTLCPPPEVLDGRHALVRRLIPRSGVPHQIWDVEFLPLRGKRGLVGILGKIHPVPADRPLQAGPLPELLLSLRVSLAERYTLHSLNSSLPAMRRLAAQVRLAAQTTTPVLIVGEVGTGKEWVARTIHCQGPNRDTTFAALDCARFSPPLLATALFGETGLAHRPSVGVIYLREPACLPRELQARLCELRGIAGALPPRLMAGSSTNSEQDVRDGRLLEGLHCLLGTLVVSVPPLRERAADVLLLADRFVGHPGSQKEARPRLTAEALQVLQAHSWPGNLREFFRVLTLARAHAREGRIDVGDLPAYIRHGRGAAERSKEPRLSLRELMERTERRIIQLALDQAQGNKTRAAEALGVYRPYLLSRLTALGMVPKGEPPEEKGKKDE